MEHAGIVADVVAVDQPADFAAGYAAADFAADWAVADTAVELAVADIAVERAVADTAAERAVEQQLNFLIASADAVVADIVADNAVTVRHQLRHLSSRARDRLHETADVTVLQGCGSCHCCACCRCHGQ